MGRRGRFKAWKVIVIAQRERERRSSEFSSMTPLGGEAGEMGTQRRSTEVTGGAPMRR
jgi:hypothetical protein